MESPGIEHGTGQIQIRCSSLGDLPHLMAISEAAIYAARWTEQQWQDIFHTQNPPRLAWIAWESGGQITGCDAAQRATIPAEAAPLVTMAEGHSERPVAASTPVGFLVAQCGDTEWELENMAVLPPFRRRGAGSALLAALLAEARARHAERILLEVRPSNEGAIRLYRRGGFELLARRPGYYREPAEDALIMGHVLRAVRSNFLAGYSDRC